MAKKTGKKVSKVTKLQKAQAKKAKKKTFDIAKRRKELEDELVKSNNLIGGLLQRLEEAKATAQGIAGALELLKEME